MYVYAQLPTVMSIKIASGRRCAEPFVDVLLYQVVIYDRHAARALRGPAIPSPARRRRSKRDEGKKRDMLGLK